MEWLAVGSFVYHVVGRNGLNGNAFEDLPVTVFHDDSSLEIPKLVKAGLCHDHGTVRLEDMIDRCQVEMVPMMMGDKDQIRIGHAGIIRLAHGRIYVYDHVIVFEHERAMPDKSDDEFSVPCIEDIFGKFSFH